MITELIIDTRKNYTLFIINKIKKNNPIKKTIFFKSVSYIF